MGNYDEKQKWYESRTILVLIIPALVGVYKSFSLITSLFGLQLPQVPEGLPDAVINLILAIGTLLGIYFRKVAVKVIQ